PLRDFSIYIVQFALSSNFISLPFRENRSPFDFQRTGLSTPPGGTGQAKTFKKPNRLDFALHAAGTRVNRCAAPATEGAL
ncbi:MAG TPA: hypothetical protein PK250_11080, partial [Syntrophobacter fumaroxidans]|nr:hypothetical protein [Syntrophobacter fumaroxidans]